MVERSIDELIQTLKGGDYEAQKAAAEALAALGDAAVEPLLNVMRDYVTGDDLYLTLNNAHEWAEIALISIGEPAVERLLQAVREDNLGVRVGAIVCLGQMQEARAVQSMIEALVRNDDGMMTYFDVADALQSIGTSAVRPLIHALVNENATIRNRAASILGDFKDPLATPALIQALNDEVADVRSSAAHALGQTADARAIAPLMQAARETDPMVREAAVRALGVVGQALQAVGIEQALSDALRDSDWGTRQSAAEMLIRLNAEGAEAGRDLLLKDLQSDDDEVRLGAASSLALLPIKAPQVFNVLTQLLNEQNISISRSAAWALGELGDQRAIPFLQALRAHSDEMMRGVAESALRKLGYEGEI